MKSGAAAGPVKVLRRLLHLKRYIFSAETSSPAGDVLSPFFSHAGKERGKEKRRLRGPRRAGPLKDSLLCVRREKPSRCGERASFP